MNLTINSLLINQSKNTVLHHNLDATVKNTLIKQWPFWNQIFYDLFKMKDIINLLDYLLCILTSFSGAVCTWKLVEIRNNYLTHCQNHPTTFFEESIWKQTGEIFPPFSPSTFSFGRLPGPQLGPVCRMRQLLWQLLGFGGCWVQA